MKLVQPLNSTALRFFSGTSDDVFIPDAIRALQEKYRFWRVPQSMEEYSSPKGALFEVGVYKKTPIKAFRLFSDGFSVEAKASTEQLDEIIDDLFTFGTKQLGIKYLESTPVSRGYTSTVEVSCDPNIIDRYLQLKPFLEELTAAVSRFGVTISSYEVTTILAHTDPSAATPLTPGRFVFERRANQPYSSGLFFSEAPVSTSEHLRLLNLLERVLTSA